MGDYTAVSFHLKFRKDIPQPVIDFLDSTFNKRELSDNIELRQAAGVDLGDQEMVDKMDSLIRGASVYFPGWCFSAFTFMTSQDCYVVESRASTKYPKESTMIKFLTALLPYMIGVDGTILATFCYEYSGDEESFYYDDSLPGIKVGVGYPYSSKYDSDHPSQNYRGQYSCADFNAEKEWATQKVQDFIENGYSALGFIPPRNFHFIKAMEQYRKGEVVVVPPGVQSEDEFFEWLKNATPEVESNEHHGYGF